jgi:glycolate oxidase FAD binding subunit
MTATFAADLTLAAAQAALAEHNQWLPIDGDPAAPLGSLVAANSTGPLRLGYGAWRDLLLGCQFTDGSGALITAGGRTMKNVAGYDLTKFMVGQHGIFGRIITITTRTYLRPEAALLARFAPDVRRLSGLLTTPSRPQWSVLREDALLCGYLGDQQTIAFYEKELPRHTPLSTARRSLEDDTLHRQELWSRYLPPATWPATRECNPPAFDPPEGGTARPAAWLAFRASVPPAALPRFIAEARPLDGSADAAFGVVVGRCPPSARNTIARAAAAAGGSAIFTDESGALLNLPGSPAVRALLERLKSEFDPADHLKPLPQVSA